MLLGTLTCILNIKVLPCHIDLILLLFCACINKFFYPFVLTGFVNLKSKLKMIETLMPMDFMKTVDKLSDCFTDKQVSDVYNCQSSITANQMILKYLTANLNSVKDMLAFCVQLETISTSHKLDMIISDLKKSCKFTSLLCDYFRANLPYLAKQVAMCSEYDNGQLWTLCQINIKLDLT